MKTKIVLCFAFLFFWGASLGSTTINKSIHIGDNQTVRGGLSSINGSITIGRSSAVEGSIHTVNGRIRVSDNSRTDSLKTVNGGIEIGRQVTVESEIHSVNGSVHSEEGSEVREGITTVNGSIELRGTRVGEGLTTTNGGIAVLEKSHIKGGIVIRKSHGFLFFWHFHRRPLTIRIQDGSVIEGGIRVEDDHRDVNVIISKDSQIKGRVINAKIVDR